MHEIVSDVIEGVPVLVTYCPLCFSGVVYSRELDGRLLTFGNTSALYQSDLVMYDHQTGSYWFQVAGEGVVGPLTASRLDLLPSTTVSWGEWRRLYPETRLLTGFADSATESVFADSRYGRDSLRTTRTGSMTTGSCFLWTKVSWIIGFLREKLC